MLIFKASCGSYLLDMAWEERPTLTASEIPCLRPTNSFMNARNFLPASTVTIMGSERNHVLARRGRLVQQSDMAPTMP
jgi:hypothetical protein